MIKRNISKYISFIFLNFERKDNPVLYKDSYIYINL